MTQSFHDFTDKMSQSTKRKYVTAEVLDALDLPTENQKIVKIVAGKGNNLHQVSSEIETAAVFIHNPSIFIPGDRSRFKHHLFGVDAQQIPKKCVGQTRRLLHCGSYRRG